MKSCFFQLMQLCSIRRSLSIEARKALVYSFVDAGRVDYCNVILYDVSNAVVRRMQTALNAATRLMVDAGRRQHLTPILQSLHCLPVKQQILYKIGILSFHCICGDGPAYLTEMLIVHPSIRHVLLCVLETSQRKQLIVAFFQGTLNTTVALCSDHK